MSDQQRVVGGVSCREVLASLSDFLDDELSAERRTEIEEHLLGCSWCERFGGELAAAVAAVRRELNRPEPVGEGLRARLLERLPRQPPEG